jgi:hypothetical protein
MNSWQLNGLGQEACCAKSEEQPEKQFAPSAFVRQI